MGRTVGRTTGPIDTNTASVTATDGSTTYRVRRDPQTVEVLRRWRERQERDAAELGCNLDDDETVFARIDGVPTHPDYFSQVFERRVEKSSLPRIWLHDYADVGITTTFATLTPRSRFKPGSHRRRSARASATRARRPR